MHGFAVLFLAKIYEYDGVATFNGHTHATANSTLAFRRTLFSTALLH